MQQLVLPALGMAPGDVYLAEWLIEPGSKVAVGDPIALIETDKAELSVDAEVEGVLGRHLVAAGELAAPGSTIAWVLQTGESEPMSLERVPVAASGDDGIDPAPVVTVGATTPALNTVESRADRTRDLISAELSSYTSSPRQRAAAELATPPRLPEAATSPVEDAPRLAPLQTTAPRSAADRYRSAVATAVSRSWAEIPHFSVDREIRTEKLDAVFRSFRVLSSGVTFTDVLIKAYALALIDKFDTTTINLGLAVATPNGVAIPVLPSVATADLLSIARLRKAAVERATAGQLTADDALPAHSTLSNLGAYEVDSFTGIVPFGQTSILTVGSSSLRPVIEDGALAVGRTMHVTLNVDHRVWDGQHAAVTLRRLASIAAEPTLLLQLTPTNR